MKKSKGCINKNCVANEQKIFYKETDSFCSKCGNQLYFVCKNCYMQLPDNTKKYCDGCIAEKKDTNDKRLKKAKEIGGPIVAGVGVVAGVVAKYGKPVVKAILKVK